MNLNNFLFNPDLNAFTRLLTKEIMQFEHNTNCTFSPLNKRNHAQWLPHDDFLEWDPCPDDICYGRFYEYQPSPTNTAKTEIWVGLEILKKDGVFFSVWIDRINAPNYHASFINKHGGSKTNISELLAPNTSTDYYIVRLLDTEFTNYCSSAKGISGNLAWLSIIQSFFTEVFF